VFNAVLRHKPAQERDYLPHKRPFPYDIAAVKAALAEIDARVGVLTLQHDRLALPLSTPLPWHFTKRYKRFFADELASGNSHRPLP